MASQMGLISVMMDLNIDKADLKIFLSQWETRLTFGIN